MHLFIKQRIERRKEITKRAYKNLTLLSRSVITRDLILMHLYVVPAARNTWPPPSHLVQQEIQTQDEVKVEKLRDKRRSKKDTRGAADPKSGTRWTGA